MSKTAFLFPGQGAQKAGMGKDFFDCYDAAKAVFSQASEILGWDVAKRCFTGPQDELNRTAVSQPAILTVSIAIFRVMQEETPDLTGQCAAAAGLSLGEYSALVVAGGLEFAEALKLVQKRGQFMEEACRERQGAMSSVIGLDEAAVRAACAEAGGEVWPANFNSPGQVVISGSVEAVKKASELCVARGAKRALPLAVAGAFHTPFMASAAEKLRAELAKTSFKKAAFPVAANATADCVSLPEQFHSGLAAQVVSPVLWQQSIERLSADGWDRFVEVGPGNVLTGLMRRINAEAEAINVSTVEALGKLKGEGA